MRRKILSRIEQREVNLGYLEADADEQAKYILTDAHNPLGKLQEEQGGHHWEGESIASEYVAMRADVMSSYAHGVTGRLLGNVLDVVLIGA